MSNYILGLSCYYHDSAVALIKNGEIIIAVQEERFSRKKHDSRFPINAIRYCLKSQKIDLRDIESIVYYEKPLLTFERLLETYLAVAPRGVRSFIAAMQDDSPIKNKVGAAPLPGADRVWNRVSNSWENQYNQAPYIVWGWAVGVAKKSKVKDMAFDYLCFFSNGANHQADLAIGRFGVNPFKNSDFDPNIYINSMGWDPEIANSYTQTLLDMEKSNNRVFPLRVPGVFEFTSAVATGTSKALAGQLSPQEALDEVAKEWEAIVSRVGKKAVQDAYAVGVKMEDNKL